MEDNYIHSLECEEQADGRNCICDELYALKLEEQAQYQIDAARDASVI